MLTRAAPRIRVPTGVTFAQWQACAVAPASSPSSLAVRELGLDARRLEAAAATPLRAGVAAALAGVRTKPTERHPDGISRGTLVRHCGKLHAVLVGGAYDIEPACCRQRPCPSCARKRARDNAADLTRAMQHRRAVAEAMFLFATLTQPKRPRHEETPREAVDRIVRVWQRITNSKTATGREFRRRFEGGLRTTETTFAARGEQREHGGAVEFSGYHAHLHVLLEVRAGIDRGEAAGWLQDTWLTHCDGARAGAQCVRPASTDDAGQLCKYVTKPLENAAGRPAILRELFGALHGVRLLQAFGSWMGRDGVRVGWRELGDDEPDDDAPQGPRYVGPELGELWSWRHARPEGTTDSVVFRGHAPGDELVVSAAEAWEAIDRAVSARVLAELGEQLQAAAARAGPSRASPPDPS